MRLSLAANTLRQPFVPSSFTAQPTTLRNLCPTDSLLAVPQPFLHVSASPDSAAPSTSLPHNSGPTTGLHTAGRHIGRQTPCPPRTRPLQRSAASVRGRPHSLKGARRSTAQSGNISKCTLIVERQFCGPQRPLQNTLPWRWAAFCARGRGREARGGRAAPVIYIETVSARC